MKKIKKFEKKKSYDLTIMRDIRGWIDSGNISKCTTWYRKKWTEILMESCSIWS